MPRPAALLPKPIRCLLGLAAIALAAAAPTRPATAAPVTDLVAERATQDYGPGLPDQGYFKVRLAEGLTREGELIREFWIDKDTGQFIANVVTDTGEVRRVWGLATLTVPVPVPVRRIMPDSIVQPEDIETVELPWTRVNAYAVTEETGLVGMQVRRMLSPGRPVQLQSVMPPIIIARGDRVTIQLVHKGMQLSAAGKAISDAHLGQEVRVVNLSSNKTIVGVARGDGLVEASF